MNYLIYIFQIILIKYTTAQVISLGGRNFLNNQNCANLATNYANNARLTNIGQTGQFNNIIATSNKPQDFLLRNANYGNIANANVASSNFGGSNVGLANIGGSNLALANIAESADLNKSVPTYANVAKPPREYGIEFSSLALQVKGDVEVNGRMPFNGNVAVNGPVPTQGQGAVNYTCDQVNNEES